VRCIVPTAGVHVGDGIYSTCTVRQARLQCQVAFKMDIATVSGIWNRLRGLQQPCCSGLGVGRPAGKTPSKPPALRPQWVHCDCWASRDCREEM